MTQADPARDLRELIAAHLADELSDAQRSTLNELLRTDEKARSEFAAAIRQDVLLGEVLREEAARGEPKAWSGQRKATGEPESPSRRRTAMRFHIHPSIPSWIGLLVAAGFLIAVAMFLALGPSGPDPGAARVRALKEAEGRKLVERERALALAEAKHRDAMERLREIEKKSQELLQPPAQPNPNPLEEELRKKKRAELQEEKERVEQVEREMREAIELAKKTDRRVPIEQDRDEKAPPSQESPAVKQKLTTQMVIARVEEAAGQVFLVTKEGKTPLTSGGNLLPAQGLETGGGASRLVLRFPDKTRVELGPETELGEITMDSGKRLWMGKGTMQAQVFQQPKDQPMIFATPYGEAKVLGTTLRITVDPDSRKGTRLEVDEGKVELKNLAGRTVVVEGWHYAVATEGVDFVARKQDAPSNVPRSGLAVWLRADQGVILSGSRGVATWADRSGNKHDAVQLVPTQQPTLVPNAVQGHPVLR
ncbi:MAG TPA: FecR domain-containing protein, partial [Planctomycetota bacterium]|nr:FecR domain-containing protein [Planctomycetota bacterium]